MKNILYYRSALAFSKFKRMTLTFCYMCCELISIVYCGYF